MATPLHIAEILPAEAEQEKALERINNASTSMVAQANMIEVCDENSNLAAKALDATIDAVLKQGKAELKEITDPITLGIKRLREKFANAALPLERAKVALKAKTDHYYFATQEAIRKENERQRKLTEARQMRAEKRAEEKGLEAPQPVIPMPTVQAPPKSIRTEAGTVTTIEKWTFEVADPFAVPRDCCSPDNQRIQRRVDDGVREIPGVRIFVKLIDRHTR